jgi:predicted Fe-S protein YdhL (DUF1289 family)
MKTPCVGFCSTTFGDPICRGCKRTLKEVDTWNLMTPEQQEAVWQRLWLQAEELVGEYVQVKNPELLQSQLQRFAVRYHPDAPPEAWVMDLLRAGSDRIRNLEAYGLQTTPKAQNLSPTALFNHLTPLFL